MIDELKVEYSVLGDLFAKVYATERGTGAYSFDARDEAEAAVGRFLCCLREEAKNENRLRQEGAAMRKALSSCAEQ